MSSPVPVPAFLFIYGSLRPGGSNPHAGFLQARCRQVGQARMAGRLFRSGSVHGALFEPGSVSSVIGDVLELPAGRAEEFLTSLDRYEGIGSRMPKPATFRREQVQVTLDDGTRIECWTWLYNLPVKGCSLVRHGDALAKEGGSRGES